MFKKKTISIFLATALTTQAVNASVVDNVLFNHTPSKSVTMVDKNGNTVKSMYYTGGFYFRFNPGTATEPLWNFSPPEIEAGCNGLNMKGMFMSLLGLDQFGAMLQNAGTSLAWGVAVGLIYSLPGVASTFKMINQWAKDIQKLLSMSCQSGIAIGQAIGDKVGKAYDGSKIDKAVTSVMDSMDISSYYQKGKSQKYKDVFGLDTLDFNWDSGFKFSGTPEASDQKKEDALIGPISDLFSDNSIGGSLIQDYLEHSKSLDTVKAALHAENSPMFYKKISINYSAGDGKFDASDTLRESIDNMQKSYTFPAGKTSLGIRTLAYALMYNFNGDLGYSNDMVDMSIKKFGEVFMCSSASNTTNSACKWSKADADKMLLEGLKEPKFTAKSTFVGGIKPINGTQLKSLILNGFTDAETKDFDGEILAPEFFIISTKAANKSSHNFFVTPAPATEGKPFFDEEFVGTNIASQCSLYKVLKGRIAEDKISMLNKTGLEAKGITCDSIPLTIFPGVENYVDILSKASDSEVVEGLERITKVNTYLTTNSVLNTISSGLRVSKVGSTKLNSEMGVNTAADSQVNVETNKSGLTSIVNFGKVVDDAKKQLDKDYPDAKDSVIGLNKYFKYLIRKIQERALAKQK